MAVTTFTARRALAGNFAKGGIGVGDGSGELRAQIDNHLTLLNETVSAVNALEGSLDASDFLASARVAAIGDITIAGPGANVDGVAMAAGERMLLGLQTDASENGVYIWTGAATAATRATDFDTATEVTSMTFVPISEGTVNAGTLWVLRTVDPLVVGTTDQVWEIYEGGEAVTADPDANDDIGDGRRVGDVLVNTTTDAVFVCADATLASAVWRRQLAASDTPVDNMVLTYDGVIGLVHAADADVDFNTQAITNVGLVDGRDVAADGTALDVLNVEETDDTLQAKRIARAVWDHTGGLTSGGSPYTFGPTLPDNAVIVRAWYHVAITFTSGGGDGAVVGLGIVTDDADGIVAGIAISDGSDPWDAGNHEGIQVGTAATYSEQTTAARLFEGTITTEDTTAGKVILYAEYVVTE